MTNPEPVILTGDCLERLKELPDGSVDAVITDPPYGLSNTKPAQVADVLKAWVTGDTEAVPTTKVGFMGKDWDSFVPPPAVWKECMRVLKPGGHMAVFAGSRTQDLMGLSIRLAGFEIRDTLGWIYGSGLPKSVNVGKAIDAKLTTGGSSPGHLRKRDMGDSYAPSPLAGTPGYGNGSVATAGGRGNGRRRGDALPLRTSEAARWDGWGTALKPAIEPILLARKSLDGTVAANVLAHGVGGLNIDASRVATSDTPRGSGNSLGYHGGGAGTGGNVTPPAGRFPANVLLDEHAAAEMDKQSGITKSTGGNATHDRAPAYGGGWDNPGANVGGLGDTGGASRFFPVFKYQAKAPKKERPVIVREDGTKIQHVAVKPLALMEWLVTLITPPGGTVLDPFAGTGTTLQAARNKGFQSIGIEQEADYIGLIRHRLAQSSQTTTTIEEDA